MQGWFNPDGWIDLLSQIFLIIGAIAVAVIPSVYAARNHKGIKEVVFQTKNAHGTNLRDDLDRVLARLDELSKFINEISRGVSGLRSDLIDEEGRRRESVRELRSDAERNRGELRSGMSHIEQKLSELEDRIPPHE